MKTPYAGYDVLAKWRTPSFDDKTRAAVARRLKAPQAPRFFSPEAYALLDAVVARLVPQDDRAEPIPLAAWIDAYLADGRGQGYRDARMPPEPDAWRDGLAALAAESQARHKRPFAELPPQAQDELLGQVQKGEVASKAWGPVDPRLFFRDDLLKLAASLYYTHPSAWSEIGFGGPASPRGYVRLGLDERDPWEAKERP